MDVSKCAIAMMGFDINKKITIHIESTMKTEDTDIENKHFIKCL